MIYPLHHKSQEKTKSVTVALVAFYLLIVVVLIIVSYSSLDSATGDDNTGHTTAIQSQQGVTFYETRYSGN